MSQQASELKQIFFKLAHFDPTYKDDYGYQVIDYLVLDALAMYGPLLSVTSTEVKAHIKKYFLVDFEDYEINSSAERLSSKGVIECSDVTKKSESVRFQILPETKERIDHNLIEIQSLEEEVIENWKNELFEKYKTYNGFSEKIESIVHNLQLFITNLLIRHGVECVALLYPEDSKTKGWLEERQSSVFESLPKIDPDSDAISRLEIPAFFDNPVPKRQQYISSVFNSSFFWHLMQVDQKLSMLLREVTKGQRLYLDNNILYDIVGLHGSAVLQAVHSMLNLSRNLGYELWVTTKTIDEFHESLRWRTEEFKQKLPIPAELVRIAVENLGTESFVTIYWKNFLEHKTSIEEFYSEKTHLDEILNGLEIQVTNKFRKDIDKSATLSEEMGLLSSVVRGYASEHIIEHDAFHRIFIQKIRKEPKYKFSDASAWFLTNDSKLPAYAQVALRGKHYLPFCITSYQWTQINRPLLTRTASQDELEESFFILVTKPFLRSMITPLNLENAYQEVLGRLTRYENMNPDFARTLVADTHFMVSIAKEEDEMQIGELVENRFVDLANALQSENELLQRNLGESRASSIQEIENLSSRVDQLEKNIDIERIEYQTRIEAIEADKREEELKRKSAEDEVEKTNIKFKDFKLQLRKWGAFFILTLIIGAILIFQPLLFVWPWLDMQTNNLAIRLTVFLSIIPLILIIPLKHLWKWLIGISIAFVVAFLGIISQ